MQLTYLYRPALAALLGVALLGLPLLGGAQDPSYRALAYNDAIVEQQNRVIKGILRLSSYFDSDNNALRTAALRELQQTTVNVLALTQAMPGYEGSTALRDAALPLFTFYRDVMMNEYARMVEILNLPPDQVTEEDYAEMGQMIDSITAREQPLDDAFRRAQRSFAAQYGFRIGENPYQEQIDRLGEGE
jgi:hypothetical protein